MSIRIRELRQPRNSPREVAIAPERMQLQERVRESAVREPLQRRDGLIAGERVHGGMREQRLLEVELDCVDGRQPLGIRG